MLFICVLLACLMPEKLEGSEFPSAGFRDICMQSYAGLTSNTRTST